MQLPKDYHSNLDLLDTEIAIKLVKDTFERKLAQHLKLTRVSAPLMVLKSTGLNDDLNGVERPVQFDAKDIQGEQIQIVHSLAKWKRQALKLYNFRTYKGLYTDMNAIRRDEDLDCLHSIYVDQWDWEKIINREDRNQKFLRDTVLMIYEALKETEKLVHQCYPNLPILFGDQSMHFVTTDELYEMYPELTPKQREYEVVKKHKVVFIERIGDKLGDGKPHDGRAPDYDDWQLNGDIMVWYDLLDCAFELSSMGIRVDEAALKSQLQKAGCTERENLPFHKALLNGELPLTMGGGIGQSRLCMCMLHKAHIGEVQASLWSKEVYEDCHNRGIELL